MIFDEFLEEKKPICGVETSIDCPLLPLNNRRFEDKVQIYRLQINPDFFNRKTPSSKKIGKRIQIKRGRKQNQSLPNLPTLQPLNASTPQPSNENEPFPSSIANLYLIDSIPSFLKRRRRKDPIASQPELRDLTLVVDNEHLNPSTPHPSTPQHLNASTLRLKRSPIISTPQLLNKETLSSMASLEEHSLYSERSPSMNLHCLLCKGKFVLGVRLAVTIVCNHSFHEECLRNKADKPEDNGLTICPQCHVTL